MRVFLFILLTFNCFCNQPIQSVQKTVLTSTYVASSLVNASLPENFLDCGNDYMINWRIDALATSSGCAFSVCRSSSVTGLCLTSGDTSVTSEPVTLNQKVYFGFNGYTYNAEEVTTNTKFDGSWIFRRRCITKDAIK